LFIGNFKISNTTFVIFQFGLIHSLTIW